MSQEKSERSGSPNLSDSKQHLSQERCEACHSAAVEKQIVSDEPDQPYRLCGPCADRLDKRALRPSEWFNLASLHGPNKFLLHDDFYTEDGIAEQPKEPVVHPERFPAPTLNLVRNSLDALLDYTMTRYYLTTDVVDALETYKPDELITALDHRVTASRNIHIEATAYEICSLVLLCHFDSFGCMLGA